MKARQVAYIAALVAVELLAPQDANAGGIQEQIAPSGQMVTISQSEYKRLIQDQMRLTYYEAEGNAEGYAISISGANDIIEEQERKIAKLEDDNNTLRGTLLSYQKGAEQGKHLLSFAYGGGLLLGDTIGAYADAEMIVKDRWGISSSVMYAGSPYLSIGVRYHR